MSSLAPLSGTLGTRRAAHLLRRTSFRFTKQRVDLLAGMTAANAVAALLNPPPLLQPQPLYDDSATPAIEATAWINPVGLPYPAGVLTTEDFKLRPWVLSWWLSEAYEDTSALHKMMFFMYQYNVTTLTTSRTTNFFDYLSLLRLGALGNWKKMVTKMILDNTMLVYLNNNTNTSNNPQENFAREFLELFTIGKGPQIGPGDYTNYTEDDIVQAAKVFTGCRTKNDRTIVDAETGIPKGVYQANVHNWTEKKFSTHFQGLTIPAVTVAAQKTVAKMEEEMNLFVNRVFDQPETAKNFCRRLYRYFVNEKITDEIETDIIVPLATTFKNGNFEVKPVLEQLFKSKHFFGEDNTSSVENFLGGMIRNPLDLAFHSISMFGITIPDPATNPQGRHRFFTQGVSSRMVGLAGMNVLQPSDVAGYPAFYQYPDYSHLWFNSSSIIARYKLAAMLLSGKFTIGTNTNGNLGVKLDIAPWVKNSGFFIDPSDPQHLVERLLDYMLPQKVDAARFEYFYNTVFLDNLPPYDWTYEWDNYVATNNATEVKIALERLINAIMYSQEYQTV
jgi:uncharacterized protein (DUF1800 family)